MVKLSSSISTMGGARPRRRGHRLGTERLDPGQGDECCPGARSMRQPVSGRGPSGATVPRSLAMVSRWNWMLSPSGTIRRSDSGRSSWGNHHHLLGGDLGHQVANRFQSWIDSPMPDTPAVSGTHRHVEEPEPLGLDGDLEVVVLVLVDAEPRVEAAGGRQRGGAPPPGGVLQCRSPSSSMAIPRQSSHLLPALISIEVSSRSGGELDHQQNPGTTRRCRSPRWRPGPPG